MFGMGMSHIGQKKTDPNSGMKCLVCHEPYDKLPKGVKPKMFQPVGAIVNRANKPNPTPADYDQYFFCITHYQDYDMYIQEVKDGKRTTCEHSFRRGS